MIMVTSLPLATDDERRAYARGRFRSEGFGQGAYMGLFRFLARITIGVLFVGHGTQKLFGWFGGGGPEGTGKFFEQAGLKPGRRQALAAGAAMRRRKRCRRARHSGRERGERP